MPPAESWYWVRSLSMSMGLGLGIVCTTAMGCTGLGVVDKWVREIDTAKWIGNHTPARTDVHDKHG
jgi:hypothetical protein